MIEFNRKNLTTKGTKTYTKFTKKKTSITLYALHGKKLNRKGRKGLRKVYHKGIVLLRDFFEFLRGKKNLTAKYTRIFTKFTKKKTSMTLYALHGKKLNRKGRKGLRKV